MNILKKLQGTLSVALCLAVMIPYQAHAYTCFRASAPCEAPCRPNYRTLGLYALGAIALGAAAGGIGYAIGRANRSHCHHNTCCPAPSTSSCDNTSCCCGKPLKDHSLLFNIFIGELDVVSKSGFKIPEQVNATFFVTDPDGCIHEGSSFKFPLGENPSPLIGNVLLCAKCCGVYKVGIIVTTPIPVPGIEAFGPSFEVFENSHYVGGATTVGVNNSDLVATGSVGFFGDLLNRANPVTVQQAQIIIGEYTVISDSCVTSSNCKIVP